MHFTSQWLRGLKPQEKRYTIFEENEIKLRAKLGIRVTPNGAKSFILYYYFDKNKQITLGRFPAFSLRKARQELERVNNLLDDGFDPIEHDKQALINEKDAAAEEKQEAEKRKLKNLIEIYIEKYAKVNKKSWHEDQRMLKNTYPESFLEKDAEKTRRKEYREIYDDLITEGKGVTANRLMEKTRAMLNYCVDADLIFANPLAGMKKPFNENPRDRVLSPPEIKLHWEKFDENCKCKRTQMASKLLLLTGQREIEIIGAKKSWFNLKQNYLMLPKEVTKNKKPHLVPLCPMAIEIVKTALEKFKEGEYLFPSRVNPEIHIVKSTVAKYTRIHIKENNLPRYTPHDLRRTFTTYTKAHARSGGYQSEWVDKVLNHQARGVTSRHYDMYAYFEEKRIVLDAWEDILKDILKEKIKDQIALR